MRNKNLFRVKNGQSVLFCSKKRNGWWMAADGRASSAAFALPARHASPTADIYVFTVGFFYRGLSEDVFS